MGQVNGQTDLSNITDPTDFMRFAASTVSNICDVLNGAVEFDKNILSQTVTVTFSAANADQMVNHNLKKAGVKYFPISKSAACDIYSGSATSSTAGINLRCTTAGATVTLVLM